MTTEERNAQLRALTEAGASVTVRMRDGTVLGPHAVDWMRAQGDSFDFWWAGNEERLHLNEIAGWSEGQSGDVIFRTPEGHELTVSFAWEPELQDKLRRWVNAPEAKERNRPVGGWTYAGL